MKQMNVWVSYDGESRYVLPVDWRPAEPFAWAWILVETVWVD